MDKLQEMKNDPAPAPQPDMPDTQTDHKGGQFNSKARNSTTPSSNSVQRT